ncbi:MAG: hypothetical protein IKS32_03655 [Solobacterium sp.]|nr:hypothetical protein [Solobacterium sp.]
MDNENMNLNEGEVEMVNSASSFGYCPYTEDRNCRIMYVGGFDNSNEECRTCSYRAW